MRQCGCGGLLFGMGLRSPSSLVYQSSSSSSRRSVPSMACSSLLSPAATISSALHSDSAGVTHRVHLSLSSDSRFFPILQEQETQGRDLQSSYNGFCTSRGGFSCSKNGGCVRRACCFRVRAHSALLASSPPGRMGGRFRVWALSASLAYPPAGRREDCTRVRALSNTVASSLKKTDTASPANPNPSLTWGIIPHPPEASQKVIDYLRSKGIDTTELEDVELPSSIEVMQERLEFLTKIGLSMETINSYPLMVTCSIKKNLIPVLDYLEQLGFRSRDLPSFLEKYPMVLHSSVVIDLMPVIDYLLGLDIQRKDIHHVLMRFPDVLGFRLEGTMSTSVAYLVSIGVRPRSIGRMLTEYPEILGMRVANTIKPKVDLLLRHGIPKSIVATILEKRPYILGFDFNETMQPAVDDLLEAGVKREAISAIITQYPDILGQSIKENFTRKTRWLVHQVKVAPCDVPRIIEKLPQVLFIKEGLAMERVTYFLRAGCSADDVATMVTVCPQLLAMSISQALEPSLNFLRQDMKRSVKEVVKFPTYFTYDLNFYLPSLAVCLFTSFLSSLSPPCLPLSFLPLSALSITAIIIIFALITLSSSSSPSPSLGFLLLSQPILHCSSLGPSCKRFPLLFLCAGFGSWHFICCFM